MLLSTINVWDYGAVANDGRDDSAAVMAAVKAAHGGDTLKFGAGRYDFDSRVEIRVGLDIVGDGRSSTTVRARDGIHAFWFRYAGLHVSEITFDGGAFLLDRGDGIPLDDIRFNNCDFVHFNRGSDIGCGSGAIGAVGYQINNASITNCSFRDSPGAMAIYFWTGDNWTITDNEFINTNGAFKTNNAGITTHNFVMSRNYWSGTSRMGVELQGQVDGFWFEDNYYENPVLSSNYDDNLSTMAWSVIYHGDQTRNVFLRRNTVKAPQRPDGTGVRQVFEAGNGATITDNYIDGIGTFLSVFMGDSAKLVDADAIAPSVVMNNRVRDVKWGIGHAYGQHERKATFANNTPDVALPWDINRPRPGPNRGQRGSANSGFANPEPQPTYLSDLRWKRAVNGWGKVERDRSNGERAQRDGRAIVIGGKRFKKGLGVARNSAVTYQLDGTKSKFRADVGVDDEVGKKGSMRFVVFADGKKIYDSGTLKGTDGAKRLDLDIAGVKELKLVTTDAGDGAVGDHGSWGGARVV